MSANPIWIAGYFGPIAGAAPVWIAPGDGTVPSAVQSEIVSYYAPVAGATAVWIAGFFAPPPAAIGATPITISGWGGSGGGGPPPPTSVWSASDAAANGMTLSNGGLTVTPSGVTSWQSIRGSISKTTGKLYVEFKNTVAASDALIAVGLGNSTINIAALLGNSNNYSCSSSFNGVGNYISMGAGATDHYQIPYTTAAANDVFAIAIDLDAGKYWLARNNVWYGSGNPGGGTNHIMNYTPATVGALFPAMSYDGVGQGVWTLQPTAASQTYAPPGGFVAWDSAAPTHSAEALAYLARTVGGNEGGNATNIATLIDGLVSDGVWAKLDALYVLAQQNAADSLLNLIGTNYSLVQVGVLERPGPRTGSVVFTSYQGYNGFSVHGSYLDTGFNPSTAPSPQFAQNSGSFGAWIYNIPVIDGGSGGDIGNSTSAAGLSNIIAGYNDGFFYCRVNASGAPGAATPGVKGLYTGDRSVAANLVPYVNGSARATVTSASVAPASVSFRVGDIGGAPRTENTLSAAFIGASLGAAGQLALYNRLRTYLTTVGVP